MNKEEGDGRPSKDWNYISRARLARLGEHIAFAAKTLDASTDHTRPRFAAPGNAHPFCFPTNCYGSEPSFSGPPCRPIRPQCCIPPSHSARGVMPASVTHWAGPPDVSPPVCVLRTQNIVANVSICSALVSRPSPSSRRQQLALVATTAGIFLPSCS